MQTLVNKVQLIGHLGMDPEVKTFESGKMLRVSIATDASYTDKSGNRVQDTHWHTLVAWNKTADQGEKLLKKGKHVAIEGTLVNRSAPIYYRSEIRPISLTEQKRRLTNPRYTNHFH